MAVNSKFAGQTIPMIRIRVTDRNTVRPVELGIRMLRAFYAHHPTEFKWRDPSVNAAGRTRSIDRLAGTDQLTKAVEQNTINALIKRWDADAVKFSAMVKPYLLYK